MRFDIVPTNFWRVPAITSDLLEDIEEWMPAYGTLSGLSMSEDDKNVYVEAAVPGVEPKDTEVTFDKGVLWIKGERKEEEKSGKKYYRKASSSFSYRVTIPTDVDWKTEPTATCKNGIMHVIFAKSPKTEPKKIAVKVKD